MNDTETKTLGEALPEALARAREIQGYAREIGPAGGFLVAMIERDIQAAERAMLEGNLPGMIAAYQALVEIEE